MNLKALQEIEGLIARYELELESNLSDSAAERVVYEINKLESEKDEILGVYDEDKFRSAVPYGDDW